MNNLELLNQGFKVALLWMNEIDDNSIHNISDCTNQQIDILIGEFLLSLNNEEMKEFEKDPEQFGHWLALSCGGHGAGFFDSDNETVKGIDNKTDDNNFTRCEAAYIDDGIVYVDFFTYGKG